MAYQGGKLSDGTPLNVAVYRAYRNAGLSHSQALAVTAEVGRENGYNPSILFGSHIDPAGNSGGGSIRNVGMLSWNGNRGKNLEGFLRSRGVLSNQGMARNQANLNAQAAFSVQEMKSPSFRGGLQNFWSNPNANPDSYARELGKNYIVWAYGQNSIRAKGGGRTAFNWQAHDNRRRGYLNTLSQMAGGQQFSPMQNQPPMFQPPQIRRGFNDFVMQASGFKPPEIKKGFDKLATQVKPAFTPPPVQQGFDKLLQPAQTATQQPAFTPPPVMQGFDKLQPTTPVATVATVATASPPLPTATNAFLPPKIMPNFTDLQKNGLPVT